MAHPIVSSLSLQDTRAKPSAQKPRTLATRALLIVTALAGAAIIASEVGADDGARAVQPSAASAVTDRERLRTSCEAGGAVACNELGVLTSDRARAFPLFERACNGGSADACNNLGALHENGEGTTVDLEAARRHYTRACDSGVALGCSNLGALYATGRGVARDRAEAERLFFRACEAGLELGCSNLGALAW